MRLRYADLKSVVSLRHFDGYICEIKETNKKVWFDWHLFYPMKSFSWLPHFFMKEQNDPSLYVTDILFRFILSCKQFYIYFCASGMWCLFADYYRVTIQIWTAYATFSDVYFRLLDGICIKMFSAFCLAVIRRTLI